MSPTSVTLNKTTLSLVTGANETLTATVLPANATNKNVTWSSSDSTIATVDTKGKVVAVKAGTATITVKTVDGDKSADCELTVTTP
ncbi:TPA: Ig domain-containing protein [Enterococcus faecium]|nr:Ig-like domain-containing protein [Enterococcus faecium]